MIASMQHKQKIASFDIFSSMHDLFHLNTSTMQWPNIQKSKIL